MNCSIRLHNLFTISISQWKYVIRIIMIDLVMFINDLVLKICDNKNIGIIFDGIDNFI